MTIIEKAKLLESYGNVVEKIKELDAQEKEIIESRNSISLDDRVSKEYIEELDRSEQKIKEFNQSLKITRLRIENSIVMMENPKESKVLRMHYLEGIPWKCVALELDNKEVTIYGIRKRALSNLVV